jgi:hypothetical protein
VRLVLLNEVGQLFGWGIAVGRRLGWSPSASLLAGLVDGTLGVVIVGSRCCCRTDRTSMLSGVDLLTIAPGEEVLDSVTVRMSVIGKPGRTLPEWHPGLPWSGAPRRSQPTASTALTSSSS